MNKQQLIEKLSLVPHIEGGYFSRSYRSERMTDVAIDSKSIDLKKRCLMSSIYYLLTDDSPIGHLHKNKSDIIHYFQGGSPINYLILHANGTLEKKQLGFDLDNGQQLQLIVYGGCWKASELETGEFGLVSEAVSPGFDYDDMELTTKRFIKDSFPDLSEQLLKYIR